jgi:hypothetical protein
MCEYISAPVVCYFIGTSITMPLNNLALFNQQGRLHQTHNLCLASKYFLQLQIFNTILRNDYGLDSCGLIPSRGRGLSDARLEVFMVMKIQVEVFWVVTLCSIAVGQ